MGALEDLPSEDLSPVDERDGAEPRASLLATARDHPGLRAQVWMGGAHSQHGEAVRLERVASAWVLDLAGDMPAGYRAQASRWRSFVFADVEAVPPRFERFQTIVRELAAELRSAKAPKDIYVMCQYGYNRSGLAAGLLLRELGMDGAEAVALIRERRPGALANAVFSDLILRRE